MPTTSRDLVLVALGVAFGVATLGAPARAHAGEPPAPDAASPDAASPDAASPGAASPGAEAASARAAASASATDLAVADAAYARGDWKGALDGYRRAFAREPSAGLAASLGRVELELGRSSQAQKHLDYALAHLPADASPEVKRRLEGLRTSAHKAAGATGPGAAPDPDTSEATHGSALSAGYVGLVVAGSALAAGSLAAGMGLLVRSQGRRSYAADKTAALPRGSGACAAYLTACSEIDYELGASDDEQNASVGLLVASAALWVATGTYAGVAEGRASDADGPDAASAPAPTVTAIVLPAEGGATLSLAGSF
ncbi:MAG: hypothetical protein IT373_31085 [Polyangiaceae bacterium]|nr:hypothetical protein [Polyangiaceae bacterium]